MRLKFCFSLTALMFFSATLFAQDPILKPIPIEIQNQNGRQEADIQFTQPPLVKPAGFFPQIGYYFESGVLKVARTTTAAAGKITDTTVLGVQKASNVLIFPIVKVLDVRRWFHQQKSPPREQA